MVWIKTGDIFDTECFYIVNPVNIYGVMGKGLALEMKKRHPDMYKDYRALCKYNILKDKSKKSAREFKEHNTRPILDIGNLHFYYVGANKQRKYAYVINFPTKKHWSKPSRYEYIEKGLETLLLRYRNRGVTSIAFPLLGGGLGGLKPKRVIDLMIPYLKEFIVDVEFYVPAELEAYARKKIESVE